MLRILHFYKTFSPFQHGGIENFIRHLARGVHKYGYHTTILTLGDCDIELDLGNYKFIQVKQSFVIASTPFSWKVISVFKKLASQSDVIHYHFPWPYMDIVHLLAAPKKPYVVTYHSDIVKQKYLAKLYYPIMKIFLKNASSIVATSENYVRTSSVLSDFEGKTKIVPIGLDKELYPVPVEDEVKKIRALYGNKYFLFIGVLRYYKGLEFLIEAAAKIKAPILIMGEGPQKEYLEILAKSIGVANVIFLGDLSDQEKVNYIEGCACVVLPSHLRSEAYGISLVEACMFGKPMISCEIGTGTSFINSTNSTGLVIPPSDVASLIQAMNAILADDQLCRKFGAEAEKRYVELFSGEKMANAYVQIYEEKCGSLI